MPLIPSFIERLYLFNMNKAPGPFLDIAGAVASNTVTIALRLGLFDVLNCGSLTHAELASKLNADSQGIKVLAEMLEAFGYLRNIRGRWSNSPMTSKWLVKSSPTTYTSYFRMWNEIALKFFNRYMENAIRKGKPELSLYDWLGQQPPDNSDLFQCAIMEFARLFGDQVVRAIGLPDTPASLLDIGGGHGLYSIKFCEEFPQLSAIIVDSPDALGVAQKNVDSANMNARIFPRPGNY